MKTGDPVFILKFIEEKYLREYLEEGLVWFSKSEYFINLEKNGSGQDDEDEGVRMKNLNPEKNKLFFRIKGKEEIHSLPYTKSKVKMRNSSIKDVPIACFTLLKKEDLELVSNTTEEYKIKNNVINQLARISNGRPVVISAFKDWAERFYSCADKEKEGFLFSPVEYYKESIPENLTEYEFENTPLLPLFKKREKYKEQREYRVIIQKRTDTEGEPFKIGNQEDYSGVLDSVEELDNVRVQNIYVN